MQTKQLCTTHPLKLRRYCMHVEDGRKKIAWLFQYKPHIKKQLYMDYSPSEVASEVHGQDRNHLVIFVQTY